MRTDQRGARAEALAGCTAGVLGTLLGYPLDSLKTRMQAGAGSHMMPLARQIVRNEGWLGFYRGVASPLAALTILNTLNFSAYAYFRKLFQVRDDFAHFEFQHRIPIAAVCVAPLSSLISTPFELVKTQAVQSVNHAAHASMAPGWGSVSSPSSSSSSSSIVRTIALVRQHGARALYIAHGVNTAREMVFLSTYFTIYEHGKKLLNTLLAPQAAILLSGGLSGAMGWFVSFPLDCIKSNLQGRRIADDWRRTQPSAYSVAASLLKSKGIAGLYSGIVPSIARAFLVSSSRFAAYEGTLWLCRRYRIK